MNIRKEIIKYWKKEKGFLFDFQAEKDLLIECILYFFYSNKHLSDNYIFKGGTALNKMHLKRNLRYSEDIDLSQRYAIKSGHSMSIIHDILEKLKLDRKYKQSITGFKFYVQYPSTTTEQKEKLKIETNCHEHFTALGYIKKELVIDNPLMKKTIMIPTLDINEMLGQKACALYQRKKGRDLFDIYKASEHPDFDISKLTQCFQKHFLFEPKSDKFPKRKAPATIPTEKNFIRNIEEKEKSIEFINDTKKILNKGVEYDINDAFYWFKNEIIPQIIKEHSPKQPPDR